MTIRFESDIFVNDDIGTPKNADFLREAFATEQECLAPKLKSSRRITHAGDRGEVNEQHFIDFLRKYLPKLQSLATVPAVDWMAYANQLANKPVLQGDSHV